MVESTRPMAEEENVSFADEHNFIKAVFFLSLLALLIWILCVSAVLVVHFWDRNWGQTVSSDAGELKFCPIFCSNLSSKRKKLKVWSNLSGEEAVFMSDFCPWQNDCQILLIFSHSPFTLQRVLLLQHNVQFLYFPTKLWYFRREKNGCSIVFYKQVLHRSSFPPWTMDI